LEKGNLSEQKKFLAGKNSLSKKVFSLSKKGFPILNHYDEILIGGIFVKSMKLLQRELVNR
jgi:hypothetical protein